MNSQEKIDLKRLITSMDDYEDNTAGIRQMKHSDKIRIDIATMETLKTKYADLRKTSPIEFNEKCESECFFLFSKYTDIYNRLLRDEINLGIMDVALKTLKQIEDGKIDQQEGSVIVGKLFHEIFVDSALKRSAKLDKEAESANVPKYEGKDISWKSFKTNHNQ